MIQIICNGNTVCVPDTCTVCEAVSLASPFGSEPVIVVRNGERTPPNSPAILSDGDTLHFFPVLIGG